MQKLTEEFRVSDSYRSLKETSLIESKYVIYNDQKLLNLSSNDYLSLSDANIQKHFFSTILSDQHFIMSNPSSRLMCGNSEHYDTLEGKLAKMFDKESSIVLSSGFMVNAGVLPAVTSPTDTIIADKLVHASIIEGMKLSSVKSMRFAHNSTSHLETLLKKYCNDQGEVWVVIESIYSMDGDIAPIKEILELKKRYNFCLYVDEAHAFGVRGDKGCGMLEELGLLNENIEIIVATLGKAAASSGGFLICSKEMRELLINKMRTLIFSTATAPIQLMWSSYIIDIIIEAKDRRAHLATLIERCSKGLEEEFSSHIIPIIVGENSKALELALQLEREGFMATAVRYPTVPKGESRLRVSLNSAMTLEDIDNFIDTIKNIEQ